MLSSLGQLEYFVINNNISIPREAYKRMKREGEEQTVVCGCNFLHDTAVIYNSSFYKANNNYKIVAMDEGLDVLETVWLLYWVSSI